ncbi:LCP family protein [Blastococcus tunisiensis]|uniref:LCP family protein n=1 Tax=Blastococcus tunisiensis TaxID=1798228 RepID=UPI0020C91DA8|nr:LCP family protein [Blastococcus sp. DSM 46838]
MLNAILPGTAFLAAGRRVLGAVTLVVLLALAGGAVWLATGGRRTALQAAVDTDQLLWIVAGVGLIALLWAAVVVAGVVLLFSRRRRALGALVATVLVAAVAVPAVWAGQLALTQRDLIAGVFDDGDSATVEETPDPFGDKERVNVLLLGGDGGVGREGVRTDTVIVASIDTDTGDTVLFSLPRNLQDLPFPEDSPLADVYPDGFEGANESDSLLNAVYRTGPEWYPGILGPTDDPGADFLKLGVGEALGLSIDYYVLVNLEGFSRLIDALGGITVNVNYYVPIGGEPSLGIFPDAYIAPGPDQHLDGARALDFARGRFGMSDYDRMARQRCTIQAIIDAADPMTLLRQYQRLAATTQDIISTDIPRSALDDFVDLALLVQDASITSVVFDPSVIDPAYPDYDRIREIVDEAIAPAPPPGGATPPADPAEEPALPSEPAGPADGPGTEEPTADDPVADLGDACAYDPQQAAAARAEGQPPTRDD